MGALEMAMLVCVQLKRKWRDREAGEGRLLRASCEAIGPTAKFTSIGHVDRLRVVLEERTAGLACIVTSCFGSASAAARQADQWEERRLVPYICNKL
ncbi:hypothetical protein ACLOJK_005086 [Asimina triloba]